MANATKNERDFFELFGIKRSFDLKLDQLDSKYFALQKQSHPDSNNLDDFSSALLNTAYKILKNPVSRAEYLLSLFCYSQKRSLDISDLFETQEKLQNSERTKEILDSLKNEQVRLQESLTKYSVEELTQNIADDIFEKISRIRFIKKIIDRL